MTLRLCPCLWDVTVGCPTPRLSPGQHYVSVLEPGQAWASELRTWGPAPLMAPGPVPLAAYSSQMAQQPPPYISPLALILTLPSTRRVQSHLSNSHDSSFSEAPIQCRAFQRKEVQATILRLFGCGWGSHGGLHPPSHSPRPQAGHKNVTGALCAPAAVPGE